MYLWSNFQKLFKRKKISEIFHKNHDHFWWDTEAGEAEENDGWYLAVAGVYSVFLRTWLWFKW